MKKATDCCACVLSPPPPSATGAGERRHSNCGSREGGSRTRTLRERVGRNQSCTGLYSGAYLASVFSNYFSLYLLEIFSELQEQLVNCMISDCLQQETQQHLDVWDQIFGWKSDENVGISFMKLLGKKHESCVVVFFCCCD